MDGPMISDTEALIMHLQAEEISTYWFWIRKFIPILAGKCQKQLRQLLPQNLQPVENQLARKISPCRRSLTEMYMWPESPLVLTRSKRFWLCGKRKPMRDPR